MDDQTSTNTNTEVGVFVKGINQLAHHGNSTTINSWLEKTCRIGHSDACPHLLENGGNHICAKISPLEKHWDTNGGHCDGVQDLTEFENKVKELAKTDYHFHPHESH